MAWLECVPNVSEGRDVRLLDRMAARLSGTPGVRLLDVHRDADHHRSVFTLVGEAPALTDAVLGLCDEAVTTIDLRRHHGAHPRIGAVDVVPFVPVGHATMDEAVAAARATGRALAERFGIPVLLYEEAATAPHRRRLEAVRRGRFEGLAEKLRAARLAARLRPLGAPPDVWRRRRRRPPHPRRLQHQPRDRSPGGRRRPSPRPCGASSGGLPHVKAMAVALPARGLVQVSMNLTHVEATPIAVVFDAVTREAARHGVAVAESEVVGLVPAAALAEVAARALRIAGWTPDKILDTRLLPG